MKVSYSSVDFTEVQDAVEHEGFGYTFIHYSTFSHIADDEFHRLRLAFWRAAHALADYVGVEC